MNNLLTDFYRITSRHYNNNLSYDEFEYFVLKYDKEFVLFSTLFKLIKKYEDEISEEAKIFSNQERHCLLDFLDFLRDDVGLL